MRATDHSDPRRRGMVSPAETAQRSRSAENSRTRISLCPSTCQRLRADAGHRRHENFNAPRQPRAILPHEEELGRRCAAALSETPCSMPCARRAVAASSQPVECDAGLARESAGSVCCRCQAARGIVRKPAGALLATRC